VAIRSKTRRLRQYILEEVGAGRSKGLAAQAAREFDLSRSYTSRVVRGLVDEGLITYEGETNARTYALVSTGNTMAFPVDGLDEQRVWSSFFEGNLPQNLRANVLGLCQHGVTEMVNNVADHSGGASCRVRVEYNAINVVLQVMDDGVGIFEKIRTAFDLDDERHAALELTKGKLTTDPSRHTGEGVFFTTRMFDTFLIRSGTLLYYHRQRDDDWVFEDAQKVSGTDVMMQVSRNSRRTLSSVFDMFAGPDEYAFNITHVPVKLSTYGHENLISRSQAKRLLARVDKFNKVYLDFDGVEMIGQAFADETFRVFPQHHPQVEIHSVNARAPVRRMIDRALAHES
jgi:anti-sigma regulatory factor (Ser/Thr protein kinase)